VVQFRRMSLRFLTLLALVTLPFSTHGAALIPAPPSVDAQAYLLMDADSGRVLMEHRADETLSPASLTKIMTGYVVADQIAHGNVTEDDQVQVSVKAWRTGGSRMFIREGTTVRLADLVRGIVVQSGNDASIAAAEHVAGSEDAFVDLMNQQAKRLGMAHTHYANATGMPHDNHYSSARDLAELSRHLIKDFPEHYEIYHEKYFTYNDIRQPNRNNLLWRDKTVDGIKTGHTEEAGFCLIASAKRDGMRLISVVMGTDSEESRARESEKLLSYGFRFFRTHHLFEAEQVLETADVWYGDDDSVGLGVEEDVVLTIPRGEYDNLQAVIDVDQVIEAPLERGAVVGQLRVMLGEETLSQAPLVALNAVAEGNIFKRVWHGIYLFFRGLFS
jgi:D-alanyl-D-alanine carboxypeptidase (penicillin-binding protein 5/6)